MDNTNLDNYIRKRIEEELKKAGVKVELLPYSIIDEEIKRIAKQIRGQIDVESKDFASRAKTIRNPQETNTSHKEDDSRVVKQLLLGKTPEEIHMMPECGKYPLRAIQDMKKNNMAELLAIQLIPLRDISNILGVQFKEVYKKLNGHVIDGKTILQMIDEKEAEVIRRLEAGETVVDLINDRELFVSQKGIDSIINKMSIRRENKPKRMDKKEEECVLKFFLYGYTVEEVQNMSKKHGRYSRSEFERIYTTNLAKILAVQLIPFEDIAKKVGIDYNMLVESMQTYTINGKSIADIIRNKQLQIEKRLRMGQSMDEIVNDRILNVCRESVEEVKSRMNVVKAEDKIDFMRKRYQELYKRSSNTNGETSEEKPIETLGNPRLDEVAENILCGIVEGDIDVDIAKKTILEEAEKMVKDKKNTQFSLSEEEEVQRLYNYFSQQLAKNGGKYPIKKPYKTMEILQNLLGNGASDNLDTVISNLLSRKRFGDAEDLFDKFWQKVSGSDDKKIIGYMQEIKRKITEAKVGDLVYRAINSYPSEEDERKLWELLRKAIELQHIRIERTIIGKTKNGQGVIRLQDIWPEKGAYIK